MIIYIQFSVIYLQYESVKILKCIDRITVYYDVIIYYTLHEQCTRLYSVVVCTITSCT